VLRVIRADLLVASFSDVVDFVSSAFFLGAIGRKENENEMRVRTTSSASFSPCVESREMVRVSDFLFFYIFIFLAFFRFPALFCEGTICDWVWWGDRK
jgi:hypothetical protein